MNRTQKSVGFAALLGVFVGVGAVLTPAPAYWLARKVAGSGVTLESVRGSLLTGFKIAVIRVESPALKLAITGGEVKFRGGLRALSALLGGPLDIESVAAQSVSWGVPQPMWARKGGIRTARPLALSIRGLRLGSADLRNIEIQSPGSTPITIAAFRLQNLVAASDRSVVQSIEEVEAGGPSFHFKMEASPPTAGGFTWKAQGALLMAGAPYLKRDFDFAMHLERRGGVMHGRLTALGESLRVDLENDLTLRGSLKDLTLSEVFHTSLPFEHVNLALQMGGKEVVQALLRDFLGNPTLAASQLPTTLVTAIAPGIQGSWELGGTSFRVSPPSPLVAKAAPGSLLMASAQRGGTQYDFYYRPSHFRGAFPGLWMIQAGGKKAKLTQPADILAKLYFNKSFAQANLTQKARITSDSASLVASFVPKSKYVVREPASKKPVFLAAPAAKKPAVKKR